MLILLWKLLKINTEVYEFAVEVSPVSIPFDENRLVVLGLVKRGDIL